MPGGWPGSSWTPLGPSSVVGPWTSWRTRPTGRLGRGSSTSKAGLNYRSRSRRGKRVAWVVVDAVGAVIRRGAVDVVEDVADGKTWERILH